MEKIMKQIAKLVFAYGKTCANSASQHGFYEIMVPKALQEGKKE